MIFPNQAGSLAWEVPDLPDLLSETALPALLSEELSALAAFL